MKPHEKKRKSAFTLMEICVVCLLVTLVSGTLYKIFSGTFANFFKSQTKLNNLRAASILLEYLKRDIRLAATPMDSAAPYKLERTTDTLNFSFTIREQSIRNTVHYKYASNLVSRQLEGKDERNVSSAKVASFSITEESMGPSKFLKVVIEVDDELGEGNRGVSSQKNRVTMSAILFPKFFKNFADKKEEYWTRARQNAGGSS